jgi:hypothetical protein
VTEAWSEAIRAAVAAALPVEDEPADEELVLERVEVPDVPPSRALPEPEVPWWDVDEPPVADRELVPADREPLVPVEAETEVSAFCQARCAASRPLCAAVTADCAAVSAACALRTAVRAWMQAASCPADVVLVEPPVPVIVEVEVEVGDPVGTEVVGEGDPVGEPLGAEPGPPDPFEPRAGAHVVVALARACSARRWAAVAACSAERTDV